jgi:hypothetical protein
MAFFLESNKELAFYAGLERIASRARTVRADSLIAARSVALA